MGKFEFTLVIAGDVMSEEAINALFEAGCDDATFGGIDGSSFGGFDREAATLEQAIATAIAQVETVPGLEVLRVEPDDLVTLTDIGRQLGRSRESVRLLAAGERGPGGFPGPVSHLRSRNRLWRWSDVAAWAGVATPAQAAEAKLVAAINAALELRHAVGGLAPGQKDLVQALAARLPALIGVSEAEDGDVAWNHVPTDLAERLDRWAELLQEAWTLWREVTTALTAAAPAADSQVAQEDAVLMAQHPDWGPNPAFKAGKVAVKLIDAAAQYALGIRALIKDRQLVLAPGPLLRAESEYLARACWIIDPDVTPPEGRVARLLLEHLHGAYQLRLTEGELRNRAEAKRARQFREQIRTEIERCFPGARTEPPKESQPIEWVAGGEKYPTLQAACKRFEEIFENKVQGMYAVLSHISHPNTHELDLITEWDPTRGASVYRVRGESVISQVGNAAVMLNLATSLVALYFGLDQEPLAAWLNKAVETDPGYFDDGEG